MLRPLVAGIKVGAPAAGQRWVIGGHAIGDRHCRVGGMQCVAARRRQASKLAADLGQAHRKVVLGASQQEAGAHAGAAGTGLMAGKG